MICPINFSTLPPTNRRKPQPGRGQPYPTSQSLPLPVLFHHINRQDMQALLSVVTRPDQVESINSWISGICKDYPGIIPLGAMHPEHPDPEAKILWMRQPGIKGIRLHSQRHRTLLRYVWGIWRMFRNDIVH